MVDIAVVGTGNIAPAHIEGFLTFPDRCRIVALCDIFPEKAEALKEKYHLDCRVFNDHQKMLDSGLNIDVVHICTPLTSMGKSPFIPWMPVVMWWWKNPWPPAFRSVTPCWRRKREIM